MRIGHVRCLTLRHPSGEEMIYMHGHVSAPPLFSWSVITRSGNSGKSPLLGAVGVTDDQERALERLCEALRDAPAESRGLMHKVTVSMAKPGHYYYDGLLVRVTVDACTGAVVSEEFPPRGAWGNLDALLKAAADALGDGIPPEAISAGLADLEAEVERRQHLGWPIGCPGG
jgi:hypothetical protein